MIGDGVIFNLLAIVSSVLTVKEIVKEKCEPVAPKGTRFDWNAYYDDIKNGMSVMEQVRKREHGDYMTTKPAPLNVYDMPMDTVIDVERYQHDKETYGDDIAETWRKNGHYKYISKF